MADAITNSRQFFLWDYDSSLFPLRMNRLLVEKYSAQVLDFIQTEQLASSGGFQSQHKVFATKRGWFLRPTVKLDPVAEFFFYDFIYRNRSLFRKSTREDRTVFGYRIVGGAPIAILRSYSNFKKAVSKHRRAHESYGYLDVAAYFNRIYHHDLVRWCEDAGASKDDVKLFGKFLRETAAGRSINCLPQGIYPSKMVGSAFLGFLEDSNRIKCAQSVRLMDDIWLFDDDPKTLTADFLIVQSLLSDRGLAVNEEKCAILEGHDPDTDLPPDIDQMKVGLLRRRREELIQSGYAEPNEEPDEDEKDEELRELTVDEQSYLLSLLKRDDVQEEDAELVLTLMRDHSADVIEFIPTLISEFPGLAKRLFYFCSGADDKSEIASSIMKYLNDEAQITEFQLFWFGMMAEAYLLKTREIGDLLISLYEHENATDISRAKILEIPVKRFGLPDLREEQLRTGHSDWLAWAAAVGARSHPKGQRNQLLKYFRKSSQMNRLIGEFVEECF
jgi:hypothetical protein